MTMEWDNMLRVAGIIGFLIAYGIYTEMGSSAEIFVIVLLSIGTVVMPEFVDRLPIGPSK